MAIRDLDRRLRNLDSSDTTTPTPLTDSLINNDQFNYAHLVKFEKPTTDLLKGKTSRNANTYSYITDSAFDISWDDFSVNAKGIATGTQLYNANKLTKVGTVTETTDAKASGISITLDSASLGASVSFAGIAVTSTTVLCQSGVDLVEEGFREGDKVELTTTNGNAGKGYAIIKEFQDNNRKFTYTASAEGALVAGTEDATKFHTISLASEEIHALILNKSHTSYTTYLNREVFIYKAHLDPDTNAIIGDPYLLFKGIIASGSIKEDPSKSSSVTWGLTSHWGDFSRVSGRLTVDDAHRALDGNGQPDTEALIRPEYGSDLGFAHANQSLNVMATYNDIEISYKQVDINGGWFGGKRLREVETEVERRTDLAFNLSPKYLPVVYGVQKLDSIPVFVDTDNNDASQIYVAYAICEGPIAGILDLYVDGNSSICVDKADFDLRSTAGDTVDFVCKGRMDRGDALTGYNANTSTGVSGANMHQIWGEYGRRGPAAASYRQANQYTQAYSSSSTAADSDTGILHEKTHTITSPLSGHFQVHVGKADQKANPTLTGKAASSGFKIQNDYFDGDGEYWGNQHQLLDTAYTVGKFTIAAGETSIPEIDFIVRGKGIECHNYDRSYNNTNSAVYTSAAKTNFNLGDTVALKRASNDAVIAASVTIIDKWDFLDADGATQTRFITDYGIDIANTHYMLKGTNKWYMSPDDPSDDITSTVATPAKTTVSSSSANSGGNGVDVVVSSSAAFQAAVAAAIAAAGGWVLTFNGTSLPALSEAEFRDIAFNASSNTLSGVGAGTEVSSLPDTITEVFVKNAIILNSTHSAVDAYYAGKTITLTRFDSDDVPYTQVRQIISYSNTGNTAVVDSPWVGGFMPDAGDTYVISASKPDIRVSINPAMQLLDYLTSDRYGRGLDLDLDIDLPTFKEAARLCDTRSNVTVILPNSASAVVGDIYKYADPDDATIVHFRGTVESVTSRVYGPTSTTYKEVVFKDVSGKLGHKYNTWESVRDNELIWHSTGSLYQTQAAGVYTLTAGHIITSLNLARVSGTGDASLALDVALKSDNGNPLVKSFVPFSAGNTNGDFRGTGYTLYDSDDIKYWKYIGWDSNGQRNVTRHQMNQTIATANPIFDNVNLMLKQFNGILRYSNGKYQLDVRGQSPSTFVVGEVIEEADIIGSIDLKDKGVKKTYNSVSTSIKDPQTKFESRSVSFFNSTYLKQDKSIPKKGQYGCPGITNYFNARFNINQMLDESRYGLTISFKMAPKGILLLPGSIIRLNYDRFGWVNKEFRIASIAAGTDCLVNITADEHNNDAFLIKSLAEPAVGGAIATGSVQNKNRPTSPSSLVSTFNDKSGHIKLTWTNSTEFDATNSHTEIHSSTTNNISTANLLTTISNGLSATVVAKGATGTSDTVYYWVRHTKVYTTSDGLPDRTVASLFHPSGTTGISGAEVPRYPTKWNVRVGSGQLPTSSALAQSRWGDGTGTQPTSPVTGDQAWFNTGTAENPTAQKIWLYGGSGWTEQTAAVAGNLLVDDTVTVTEIDTTAATGGTFGAAVAALDAASFSSIDTDVLDANSVIAREVQVFPVGGTAPTISGTTLAGAGIDLKQDGDLYVGNAAANKYMFWDQSAGVMTFRGTLNAGDITAGTINADRIAVGSLDADKITANTITADEIAAGAITTATLAADAITAEKIATNAITADAIAAGTITATEIAADAVTASKINVANLASIQADIGAITAGTIRGNTVPDANAAPSGAETGAFLDLTAGKMVFGNSTKHILWDGTNLTISGVTIDSATLTNSSGSFVTQSDINTSINALIDGAPGTLNTLNELAAALDDDADFHTAVTTGLNARLPLTGGAMTGAITTNSTFDGRNVSVDGTKLDGIAAGATNTATPYYTGAIPNATASATGLATSTQITKLDGIAGGATNVTNNNQLTNGAGYITSSTTSTTQSAGTDNTSIATTAFVTAAITAIGNGKIDWTADQGSTNIHSGNYINTEYSVGDGGLTQNNFTNADHTKLNGIAASANNYSFPYTVSANASNSTVVQRHSSGYIFANYFNTTPNTVSSGVTQVCVETGNDGYIRHGTAAAIRTFINVADGANNYTHPSEGVDMGAALTGANVISDVAVNSNGHVTGFATRALTLANLSYTGDSDATNGATTAQANAITANTAKTGITSAQASAITANTAKTGITSAQATAITAALPKAGGTMTGALKVGTKVYEDFETSGQFYLGNNDWRSLLSNTSGVTYSATHQGVSFPSHSGTIPCLIPIDPTATYRVKVRVKHISTSSGTGKFYFAVQTLNEDKSNLSSDTATSYNYGVASNQQLTAGQTYTYEATFTGYNPAAPASASSTKFDPEGKYFNLFYITNYQGNGETVIQSVEVERLSLHPDLYGATSSGTGSMDLELLKADTIIADHITANTIDAGKLTVGNSSSASASRLLLLEDSLKIFSGSALRVHLGNLANTDDGT